jgi:hypothetical protein
MITATVPAGGWNSMRKNRLIITVAALGSAASIAGMAAPAMAAPATTAIAARAVTNPDVISGCPNNNWLTSPGTYTVKTTGIHIRNSPASNGTILFSIAKGASFKTSWAFDGIAFGCISPSMGGTQWVLGWDVSNNKHVGWVGLKYLSK